MSAKKQFDFETMAVVLYAMQESGVTLGAKHYEMMSKVDGTRGKDSFNHQFREVRARAKELQEQVKNGTIGVSNDNGKGGEKAASEKKGGGKRAHKAKGEENGSAASDEGPAKKKVKKVKTEGTAADDEADTPGEEFH